MMGRMGRRICRLTELRVNSIVSPIQRTTFPAETTWRGDVGFGAGREN